MNRLFIIYVTMPHDADNWPMMTVLFCNITRDTETYSVRAHSLLKQLRYTVRYWLCFFKGLTRSGLFQVCFFIASGTKVSRCFNRSGKAHVNPKAFRVESV